MRHLLAPELVNGAAGDPGLFVDLHEERRALLFDLGDLAALPPRKMLRISQVFVSHTHMDHFAGFDALLRVVLGRKDRIVLTGGPGFVDQVEHKLRAYTWNVVHRYAPLVLEAREVKSLRGDPRLMRVDDRRAFFASERAFAREDAEPAPLAGDVLHDEPLLRVRGRFVDHEMPCLAFAIEEKPRARVARDRLAALGLATGAWLRELKRLVSAGAPPATPIVLRWRDRVGEHEATRSVGELTAVLLEPTAGRRIGYVTDLRDTEDNRRTLAELLAGLDQLFIESVFLDADRAHAQRKNHLTSRQAGEIARRLHARSVVPFHFSPRYEGREHELVAEVHRAWLGGSDTGDGEQGGGPGGDAAQHACGLSEPVSPRSWTRAML